MKKDQREWRRCEAPLGITRLSDQFICTFCVLPSACDFAVHQYLCVGYGRARDVWTMVIVSSYRPLLITLMHCALHFSHQNLWQKVKKNIMPQNELLKTLLLALVIFWCLISGVVLDIWGVQRAPWLKASKHSSFLFLAVLVHVVPA